MTQENKKVSRNTIKKFLVKKLFGRKNNRNNENIRQSIEDIVEAKSKITNPDDLSAFELVMLRNLMRYGKTTVEEVAIPRTDIIAFDRNEGFDSLITTFLEAGHSRIPVYSESLDFIIGMVHIKDVYRVLAKGEERPPIDSLLRSVIFVPQSMYLLDLLARMRSMRTHMAVVVDEYGGTDGLVTIEDLVEAIVGDIEDEHDKTEAVAFSTIGHNIYEIDARFPIVELESKLGVNIISDSEREEIDTIGGLMFKLSEAVPMIGDVIERDGLKLEVIDGEPRRINKIRLTINKEIILQSKDEEFNEQQIS